MSENYIVINGKKADLTPEQLEALGIEVKKKNPFDKPDIDDEYFFISTYGQVLNAHEGGSNSDVRFNIANYCTNKDLLQQQAYRETLNRLLWRFSMEHDGDKIVWDDESTEKHFIYYNYMGEKWKTSSYHFDKHFGVVYFHTHGAAELAIKEIVKPFMAAHPDFKL